MKVKSEIAVDEVPNWERTRNSHVEQLDSKQIVEEIIEGRFSAAVFLGKGGS